MTFASVSLITRDVPALASFYADVLGVEAQGDNEHTELKTKGAGLTIFSTAGMERMAPNSMQDAGSGSVILAFEVDDVDAEYVRLKNLGVEFVKPPQTHPWGSRSLWFKDPEGNIVDFYSIPS
ncbi:MAG: VOC family protein [Anaerolineae bacterium]|nr:VOC family protein [Anaerolineae bacterium]